MKILKAEDFIKMKNPNPKEVYKLEVLTPEDKAKDLGGIFGIFVPGHPPYPWHYHQKRESLIIVLSGEATEILEGKEYLMKAGDVIFIPPGEKHTTVNRSGKEFRYIEFFTYPPALADFIEVKK